MGEATHHVRQQWEPHDGERLYGLGQHQQGLLDIKGTDLELRQYNGGDRHPAAGVEPRLRDPVGQHVAFALRPDRAGGLGGDPGDGERRRRLDADVHRRRVAGDYQLAHVFVAATSRSTRAIAAGVIEHWRQGWLPGEDVAHFHLRAGQSVRLRFRWKADIGVKIARFAIKPPSAAGEPTSLWSEVGDGVDYWFIYGPALDAVIAGYRRITGEAPMMPRWAFGLWQCRERYRTAAESVAVLDGYRKRGIPVDVHRPGLAVLAPRRVGLAQLRSGALSRPGALGRRPPRPARPPHDLGVAEVLSRAPPTSRRSRRPARSTSRTSSRASRTG